VRPIVGGLGEVVIPNDPDRLCAGWDRLRQRLAQEPGLREAARGAIVTKYGLDAMVSRNEEILTRLTTDCAAEEIAREFA
jgi:hypothetical protein